MRTDGLVIMRAGHYFTPNDGDGTCQGATVAHVSKEFVNLLVLQHDAEQVRRLGVRVITMVSDQRVDDPYHAETLADVLRATSEASFHLTLACPWGR